MIHTPIFHFFLSTSTVPLAPYDMIPINLSIHHPSSPKSSFPIPPPNHPTATSKPPPSASHQARASQYSLPRSATMVHLLHIAGALRSRLPIRAVGALGAALRGLLRSKTGPLGNLPGGCSTTHISTCTTSVASSCIRCSFAAYHSSILSGCRSTKA